MLCIALLSGATGCKTPHALPATLRLDTSSAPYPGLAATDVCAGQATTVGVLVGPVHAPNRHEAAGVARALSRVALQGENRLEVAKCTPARLHRRDRDGWWYWMECRVQEPLAAGEWDVQALGDAWDETQARVGTLKVVDPDSGLLDRACLYATIWERGTSADTAASHAALLREQVLAEPSATPDELALALDAMAHAAFRQGRGRTGCELVRRALAVKGVPPDVRRRLVIRQKERCPERG